MVNEQDGLELEFARPGRNCQINLYFMSGLRRLGTSRTAGFGITVLCCMFNTVEFCKLRHLLGGKYCKYCKFGQVLGGKTRLWSAGS